MREATTRFVILGLLDAEGLLSGYEIRQIVAGSIGFFWTESFGQLYPELKRLSAEKLIAAAEDKPSRPRDRRRFRITADGRRALRDWLVKPARPRPVRIEYLLKIFFGRQAGAAVCRRILAAVRDEQQVRLRSFEAARRQLAAEQHSPGLPYWLIVLRAGQLAAHARLRWAEEAQMLLDASDRGGPDAALATLRKIESARL